MGTRGRPKDPRTKETVVVRVNKDTYDWLMSGSTESFATRLDIFRDLMEKISRNKK